jgi:hypothetical protein
MHTKKSLSGIWGFFVVIGVLLGFAMETHA